MKTKHHNNEIYLRKKSPPKTIGKNRSLKAKGKKKLML
jgi:hypothetical protein